MKYCPYCGATLLGSTASFCAECGEAVPASRPKERTIQEKYVEPLIQEQSIKEALSPPEHQPEIEIKRVPAPVFKLKRNKRSKKKEKIVSEPVVPEEKVESTETESGYDGYYDDIKPMDNIQEQGLDPELLKRICFVAGGAILVIGLSIAFMFLI